MASPDPTVSVIARNLAAVNGQVAQAAAAAGRAAGSVDLVAVSKTYPAAVAAAAIGAGHRVFGENRVQEALDKWSDLKQEFPDVKLHLIGPLQRNKVRPAMALFDAIETLDRPSLARALANEMERSGRRPDVYIQINTGEEAQKAGVAPAEADDFIAACRDDYGLVPRGLMCIPPAKAEPSLHFALLGQIARRNGLQELSMGMSADFEIAIRFGATLVRVGTAIFGPRPRLGLNC